MENKEALEKFSEELKSKEFSQLTIKNYLFFTEKFLAFSGKKASDLEEADARNYLSSINNLSSSTNSLAASAINSFFKSLGKDVGKMSIPKKEKTPSASLTKEEIKKILSSSETHKSELIISLLYSSGIKVSELVNLKKQDLDLQEKIGIVKSEKKERIFQISDSLTDKIKKYLEANPDNIYLFSRDKPLTPRNIQKIIQKTSKKAGIAKKVTPHTFRNSFAAHLLEQGTEAALIQELLGTEKQPELFKDKLKAAKNPLDNI